MLHFIERTYALYVKAQRRRQIETGTSGGDHSVRVNVTNCEAAQVSKIVRCSERF